MTTHKHKTGTLTFGNKDYQYEYWERDWNILGNTELENQMYTTLHGTCKELLLKADWKVEFPDGTKLGVCTVTFGESFEDCQKTLASFYRLYEIAQDSPDLDAARNKWYNETNRST